MRYPAILTHSILISALALLVVPALFSATARGSIFVTDRNTLEVCEYNNSGALLGDFFGGGSYIPTAIALSGSDLYVAEYNFGFVERLTIGTTSSSWLNLMLGGPRGIAVSGSDLYTASYLTSIIGKYTTSGTAVNAGLVTNSFGMNYPLGIAVSGSYLYVVTSDTIWQFTPSGAMVRYLKTPFAPVGIAASGSSLFVLSEGDWDRTNPLRPFITGYGKIIEYDTSLTIVNPIVVSGLVAAGGIAVSGSNLYVTQANGVAEYTTSGLTLNSSLIPGRFGAIAVSNAPFYSPPITRSANVSAGPNQSVTITSPTTAYTARATFINTSGGTLSVTSGVAHLADLNSSNSYNAGPVDFPVPADGSIVQIWDLNFSGGTFTGPAQLVLNFDNSGMTMEQEAALHVYHYVGGQWVDIGGVVDLNADTISISASAFSPFALGLQSVPEPVSLSLLALASVPILLLRRWRA